MSGCGWTGHTLFDCRTYTIAIFAWGPQTRAKAGITDGMIQLQGYTRISGIYSSAWKEKKRPFSAQFAGFVLTDDHPHKGGDIDKWTKGFTCIKQNIYETLKHWTNTGNLSKVCLSPVLDKAILSICDKFFMLFQLLCAKYSKYS